MAFFSFTPYDPRGLGHGYNAACAIVPAADDLILLMDADVMLFGRWGEELCAAADRHAAFDVLTCRATRTHKKSRSQTLDAGEWNRERDLMRLKHRASLARPGECSEAKGPVSGFLMLFRRKVWDAVPFPLVGSEGHSVLGIDTAWFAELRRTGRRIGVLSSPIAVHYYRLDHNSTAHLGS